MVCFDLLLWPPWSVFTCYSYRLGPLLLVTVAALVRFYLLLSPPWSVFTFYCRSLGLFLLATVAPVVCFHLLLSPPWSVFTCYCRRRGLFFFYLLLSPPSSVFACYWRCFGSFLFVTFPNTLRSKYPFLAGLILPYTTIEVTHDQKFVIGWSGPYQLVKVFIELFPCFVEVGKCGGVGTNDGIWSVGGGVSSTARWSRQEDWGWISSDWFLLRTLLHVVCPLPLVYHTKRRCSHRHLPSVCPHQQALFRWELLYQSCSGQAPLQSMLFFFLALQCCLYLVRCEHSRLQLGASFVDSL